MNILNNQKGFIVQGIVAIIALVLIAGGAYYAGIKNGDTLKDNSEISTSEWKTYTNSKDGYSFEYPSKLSASSNNGEVYLSHSIPFDNYDGGCDMKGDSELSKTLNDFGMSVQVISGKLTPPYVDGTYSKGELSGIWAYKGAEGCGNTEYYFPISNNRTLIITKEEIQVLSPIVSAEVREKVLAVPAIAVIGVTAPAVKSI